MVKPLRFFAVTILLAMTAVTVWASLRENLLVALPRLVREPWFVATLFDTYFAFLVFWFWVAYKESTAAARVFWFAAILLLGNFAIALYLLRALAKADSTESLLVRRA